jgi:tetratricopeptide (TPR) repeat protein
MRPTVSLCLIVRDEEANLAKCLEGVGGLFDEMIIVDTGSVDGTKAIAESFGAKVFDFPWIDDFAAARNESRRHATGQWIFWLDADDRVDAAARERLKKVFDRLDVVEAERLAVFTISVLSPTRDEDSSFVISQARLFRNDSGLQWEGRIHERLNCTRPGDRIFLYPTDITISHEGYSDSALCSRKQFRELRLLERDYLLNPDDPMTLFYLSRIQLWQDRPSEALRLARRSISRCVERESLIVPMAYAIVVESYLKMGRVVDALSACDEGLSHFPANAQLHYRRGCVLFDLGRLVEAEHCLCRVLQLPPDQLPLAGCRVGLNGHVSRSMLARIYVQQERWADADRELRQVLSVKPTAFFFWLLLGWVSIRMGRRQDVLALIVGLQAYPNTTMEQMLLRAQLSLADQKLEEAREFTRAAIAARPAAVEPWIVWCDILVLEGGQLHACIEAHRKVLSMDPTQTGIRKRLEQLETSMKASPSWNGNVLTGRFALSTSMLVA